MEAIGEMDEMISVIVPVYNVEKYIDECISSVVKQSFSNLEIILVDDGSSDNSPKLCDVWMKKDNRVRVIHKENGGASSARNAALEVCRGKYIVFLDSDDVLPLDAIETLWKMITIPGVQIAQGTSADLDASEIKDEETVYCMSGREFLIKDYLITTPWAKIFDAEIWKKHRFKEGIIYEDYEIFYRMFYETERVAFQKKNVYYVRDREDSVSRSAVSEKNIVLLELDESRISYFQSKGETDLLEHAYTDYYNHLMEFYNIFGYRYILKRYRKNIIHFMKLKRIGCKTKARLLLCFFSPGTWKKK